MLSQEVLLSLPTYTCVAGIQNKRRAASAATACIVIVIGTVLN
jgi:hypothetical protein